MRFSLGLAGCIWVGATSPGASVAPASALPPPPAEELSASFGVSTPEAERMRSDQLAGLARTIAARRLPVFSFLISRNGKLVFELYSSSLGRDEAHYVMSVTKSVTGALMGIAIDRQKVRSADATLPDVLPRAVFANGSERQRFTGLTVKEVLGMSALDALQPPHATDAAALERARQTAASRDHFRFALTQQLLPATGSQFQYNDLTPMLATGVIQYAVQTTLLQFAQEALFDPLGFRHQEWMHQDAAGFDNGAYGLRLRPLDMQKLGVLFLRGGAWNGRQLISKTWVDRSFRPWIRSNDEMREPNYGWYWWGTTYGNGWVGHEANGWRGQRIAVVPGKQMVITMTADIEDGTEDQVFRELIANHVIPATDRPVQPSGNGGRALANALEQVHQLKLLPDRMENRMIPAVAPKEGHTAFLALSGEAAPTYEFAPTGDAATQALALIRLIRYEGGRFVSPARHTELWNDLNLLEQAAENIIPLPEKSPAKNEADRVFSLALEQVVSRADQIARRDTETPTAQSQATQVREQFNGIRNRMR